jgi:putative endonuclease
MKGIKTFKDLKVLAPLDNIYYVYVLKSQKDNNFYTGYTKNLQKRIEEHNKGMVDSTSNRRPFKLIYYEACLNSDDALKRERYLKTSWGKRYMKNRLENYFKSI